MSIRVEPLTTEHVPAVRHMLEGEGVLAEGSPFRQYWTDFLEKPGRWYDVVLVARAGSRAEGIATASRRACERDGARMSFACVAKERRRRGIGTALKEGLDAHLAALGVPRHFASIGEGMDDARAFLEAVDFEETSVDCVMQATDPERPYERAPDVRCFLYTGGDRRLDAGIADLHNRAFARESMTPLMSEDLIEEILGTGDSWMIVAEEEKTGRVVGYSECGCSGFFISLAVARRYWGSGLADWIVDLSMAHYREAGIAAPWAFVRENNHAALRLHERIGWRQTGTRTFFSSSTGAS